MDTEKGCKAMKSAYALCRSFLRDEDGTVAMEYALIAAGVAMVLFGTLVLVGDNLIGLFNGTSSSAGATLAKATKSL